MSKEIELFVKSVPQVEDVAVTYYIHEPLIDGERYEIHFANGYGASVIRHSGSYGGRSGLYELMVLSDQDGSWQADFTTELMTVDPLGWLTENDVINTLKEITRM